VRKGSSSRWLSRFALGFEAAPQPTHRAGRIVPVMLRLAGVRKTYGKTVAVDALDLEIRRGEVFGLLGPNGAGKSTTVGLAVGLLEPDQGTVEIQGAGSPTQPAARAKIGITPQALALYEELTAEENL